MVADDGTVSMENNTAVEKLTVSMDNIIILAALKFGLFYTRMLQGESATDSSICLIFYW